MAISFTGQEIGDSDSENNDSNGEPIVCSREPVVMIDSKRPNDNRTGLELYSDKLQVTRN